MSAAIAAPFLLAQSTTFLVLFPVAMIVLALVIIGFIALLKRYPVLQLLLAIPGACVVLWVVAGTACDRLPSAKDTAAKTGESPANRANAQQDTARAAAEEYDRYLKKIEPLSDEMLRMQTILLSPATFNFDTFKKRMEEVRFHMLKVVPKLTPEERKRGSFLSMVLAAEKLEVVETKLSAVEKVNSDPESLKDKSPLELVQLNIKVSQALDKEIPEAMVEARQWIAKSQAEVKDRN